MQQTRRDFLKDLPALALMYYFGKRGKLFDYNNHSTHDLSVAAIETNLDLLSNYTERSERTLEQLANLLKNEGSIDIVLTSEGNFSGYVDINSNYNDRKRLVLHQVDGEYKLHPSSDGDIISKVEFVQDLARRYGSNIFLGTFYEVSDEKTFDNTQLHIDLNCRIFARKRKREPPEKDLLIQTSSGKTYKALSLICWEAFQGREVRINGQTHYAPPNWAINGAPYDIMLHPKDTPETSAAEVFSYVEKLGVPSHIEETVKDFKRYYSLYFKLLKEGAPLVIADRSQMGIFNKDLSPFKNFHKTKEYTVVRI